MTSREPEHSLEKMKEGGFHVLKVAGRFGEIAAGELFDIIDSIPREEPVILEMSAVEYISSTGIGCIVRLVADRGVLPARPSPMVERALALAEVTAFLQPAFSLEEAITRFRTVDPSPIGTGGGRSPFTEGEERS